MTPNEAAEEAAALLACAVDERDRFRYHRLGAILYGVSGPDDDLRDALAQAKVDEALVAYLRIVTEGETS